MIYCFSKCDVTVNKFIMCKTPNTGMYTFINNTYLHILDCFLRIDSFTVAYDYKLSEYAEAYDM